MTQTTSTLRTTGDESRQLATVLANETIVLYPTIGSSTNKINTTGMVQSKTESNSLFLARSSSAEALAAIQKTAAYNPVTTMTTTSELQPRLTNPEQASADTFSVTANLSRTLPLIISTDKFQVGFRKNLTANGSALKHSTFVHDVALPDGKLSNNLKQVTTTGEFCFHEKKNFDLQQKWFCSCMLPDPVVF